MPRYPKTFCSQCGGEFGPGDAGYSHCEDHSTRRRSDRGVIIRSEALPRCPRCNQMRGVEWDAGGHDWRVSLIAGCRSANKCMSEAISAALAVNNQPGAAR